MHFSFSFPWNREPGTYNCRLKKRTGLGPHPTLEKPQFWPLFRSMSGVLKLLILGISRTEKNSKNSAPTGTCPSTPLYVQVTTGKLGPRITSEWPTIRKLASASGLSDLVGMSSPKRLFDTMENVVIDRWLCARTCRPQFRARRTITEVVRNKRTRAILHKDGTKPQGQCKQGWPD